MPGKKNITQMNCLFNLRRGRLVSLLIALVLTTGLSTLLVSCGDDEPQDQLVGTWVGDEGDGDLCYYIFNKNGTGMYFALSYADDPDTFQSYKVVNDRLLILWDGDDDWDDEGAIEIDGKKFVIDYGDGDFMVFTKVE